MRSTKTGYVLLALLAAGCNDIGLGPGRDGPSVAIEDGVTVIRVGDAPPVVGSGTVATQERAVRGFRGVSAAQGIVVQIEATGTESITVRADDNLLDLIRTEVSDGILVIGVTASCETRNPIEVDVTAEVIEFLEAVSGARITAEDIAGPSLQCTVASGASVIAAGAVERQTVVAASGARFDGRRLLCASAEVACESGATVVVNASDEVRGSVASGASLEVVGDPDTQDVATSSGGSVHGAGD
jgi:hypothetical protein